MNLEDIKTKEDILKIKRNEFDKHTFNYLFANKDGGARFKTNQSLTLRKGTYYGNKSDITTCIGNYLINFYIFNENNYNIIGFLNGKIDKKVIGRAQTELANALQNNKISSKDMIDFIDSYQYFAFALNALQSSSTSEKTMFVLPEVEKRKKELSKQYAKEIESGDPVIGDKISKELLQTAKDAIGDDYGMAIFKSGKPSFDNNYKLLNVMKGTMRNLDGTYSISMNNYEEGVPAKDIDKFANSAIDGQYNKSVGGTIEGGYLVKKYIAGLQTAVLDEEGTDCGNEHTIHLKLTPFMKSVLLNRYIKVNGKKLLLTRENIDSFENKMIDLYDPIYCKGDKICNKCGGNSQYKNVGVLTSTMGSNILNKSMKKFHDNTIKIVEVGDIDDLVI